MITKTINQLKDRYGKMNKHLFKQRTLAVLGAAFRYFLLISLGFVILTQILMALKMAVTDHSLLGMKNSIWIPQGVSIQSFHMAWLALDYDGGFLYTMFNTAVLMVLQSMCAAFAAYSFARMKFKGSGILFGIVILTIIVPSDSLMLAQYVSFRNFDILGLIELLTGSPLNLIGSSYALYAMAITGMGVKGGLFIYIFRQNFRQLPISIEEAAFVDGAGFLKTFFSIVLPSSTSAFITVGVLSFVWNYADVYTVSLLSATDQHLPLKLNRIQTNMKGTIDSISTILPGDYVVAAESPLVQLAVANAAALLVIAPLLIMYLFIQKRFVQGVQRSGLGGE